MNKNTKTYQAIHSMYQELLSGTVLCIDPSTGSKSSKPGFAVYRSGQLIESGEIDLDITLNKSKRLYEISRTIREEFPKPDVLVVEYIPPVQYKGRAGMNSVAVMALQKSIGAILAAHPVDNLLEIPASAWVKYKPDWYKKCDHHDAVVLGICAITVAAEIKDEL